MNKKFVIISAIIVVVVLIMAVLLVVVLKPSNGTSSTSPSDLTVTNVPLGVYLEWTNPSRNGTQYLEQKIYVHESDQTDWREIDRCPGSVEDDFISVNWGGFIAGQTYVFRITGETGSGETGPSNEVTITPFFGPDSPILVRNTWGNAYVDLIWDAPYSDGGKLITGYVVHRYQYNDTTYSIFDWKNYTLNSQARSFRDSNVTNGINYHYEIKAVNEIGEGFATGAQIKPGSPSEPIGLAVQAENRYVLLTWSAPEYDSGNAITDYHILRYDYTSQTEKEMSVGGPNTHFNDSSVTNNIYYQYRICAENVLGGKGQYTTTVTGQPGAPPLPTANRNWYPNTGDFIRYHVNYSASTGLPDSTNQITVTSISPPNTMMLNLTNGIGEFSFESSKNRSALFGGNYNGADFDIYNPPSYVTANKVGVESLSTPWGMRNVEHWTFTNSGGGMYQTGEIWILNGAVLKLVTTDSGYTTTLVIEDTNIHHILTP
jgi:hypothetical protein